MHYVPATGQYPARGALRGSLRGFVRAYLAPHQQPTERHTMTPTEFIAKLDECLTPLGQALLNDDDEAMADVLGLDHLETWDTHEVSLIIDNTFDIYQEVHKHARWMDVEELADYLRNDCVNWEALNLDIVVDDVAWEDVARGVIEGDEPPAFARETAPR